MSEKKGINTTELTLLIVGSTIGSGVFGITSDSFSDVAIIKLRTVI